MLNRKLRNRPMIGNLRRLSSKKVTGYFVYMPKEKASKAYKFARPFHGPFSVTKSWTLDYLFVQWTIPRKRASE